jgi:RHS repeat-associated protein
VIYGVTLIASVLFSTGVGAADKSGVSPNTISLPKGPGSVEGLGESFQPTLNTGTAKYGLGIKLPPGTAGHQPALGLSYDGGGANGPLGFGWSLSLPSIQRRADKGIPTYGESPGVSRPDVYINESREELVPMADGFWFCKNEGAFVRYRQVGAHWEAHAPDGTKLEFGLTAAGRIEEAATSRVFSWLLERMTDTNGNVIEYGYRSFPGAENLNQKYLALVRYGPGPSPWAAFHFAALEYESREDWFEDGRAGFLVRTGKRLKSVTVGTQGVALSGHLAGDFDGDGTTDYLNRRYHFDYLSYAGAASHWSLLSKVTHIGSDGITSLPPATFDYLVSNPPDQLDAQGHVWGSLAEPNAVMDNPLVDLIDLNADGLPDVLKTESGGGAHTAWINRGPVLQGNQWSIQWANPVAVDPGNGAAWNFDLASDQTHLADMNGDGLADLVHQSADSSVFYFANQGNLSWAGRADMSGTDVAPPSPFGNPDVRTADFDFDKHIDIIQSLAAGGGIAYRIWFNLGNQTYSAPYTIEPEGGFDFALSGVQIADCNGDRVPDVARIQPGAVNVAAGLGYGRFVAPRSMVIPDFTLDDQQIDRAKLTDINGDGLADLVLERAAPGTCWYWLNLGNFTLSARKVITGLPSVSAETAVRWADLNGNGSTDLIYADAQANPRLQMVELGGLLTGGLAPNLLTHLHNGIGRRTTIDYAPSTRFALEDAAMGQPWPDPLPFPVTVVAAVRVSDSLGHEYRTQFRYHDGYYDAVEKQFRGFARVEQVEVGDPTAPTLVSRSYFDTGREFETMKGRVLRLTMETLDGSVFTDDSTTWVQPPRLLMVGTNGEEVRFAHPIGTAMDILEQGQGVPRRIESESEFDNFGNQTRSINYGIVEGANRAAFNDERITTTQYAINTSAWIIRLPMRQEVSDENGLVISRTESFYDDASFSGSNSGVVTVGNLTLQRAWITPSNAADFIPSARTQFDSYGNPIALFDPLSDGTVSSGQGHSREIAYDGAFHTYPVRETIHAGAGKPALIFQADYDEGLATIRSSTDFNGNATAYGYDPLGRLIHVIRPGESPAYPGIEYEYALAVPFGADGLVNHVETRALGRAPGSSANTPDHYLVSRQFVDGLGRSLMTKSEAEPAAGSNAPRAVVNGAVQFNARQKPFRVLNSFFSLNSGSLDELLAFEMIEAPGWQGQFHQNGTLVALDLSSAHQSLSEYDATSRVIKSTNPDGSFGRIEFEPLITRSFDENDTDPASPHFGTPMVHVQDGLGRLIQVNEVVRLKDDGTATGSLNTWTTRYDYDLNDALTRITDSQNNVKEMRYDGLKRKVWMNDPDAGISTIVYNAASNPIETIDAKGQRITYTYDGINRILTEDYHDEASPEFSYGRAPDVTFHYDEPAGSVDQGDGTRATARNLKGMLAWVADPSGEEHSSFDERGRVEWSVKRVSDPSFQLPGPVSTQLAAYSTRFEYDSLDRVTRMTYPDNDEVTYQYNARSLLSGIGGGPAGTIVSDIGYLPSAQQERIAYGNGVRTSYRYDERQRLNSLVTISEAGAAEPLIDFGYQFDAGSNILAIQDQRPESDVPGGDRRRNTQTFTYDNLYRLTRVQYNIPAAGSDNGGGIDYRYDRIGNMLAQSSDILHLEQGRSVTDPGTLHYGGSSGPANRAGRQPGDPPGPHALTSISSSTPQVADRSYPYDQNGNMTDIDGLRCTWDFKNRLVAVEDETMRAEYRYDFTGRRITKQVIPKPSAAGDQSPTSVVYVGKHFEIREHGQPTKFVFNGQTRVARVTGALSTNRRVQRLRLHAGWNLCSIAVGGSPLPRGGGTPGEGAVTAAYQWSATTQGWEPVEADTPLPAGTILWIRATANFTLSIAGTYSDPVNQMLTIGGSFQPSAGLEPLPLSGVREDVTMSVFQPAAQRWQLHSPNFPGPPHDFPEILAPGEAVFVRADAPAELEIPDVALRIRYYHQDHLGSSSVMTDANGLLVEETAFYPFGIPRHEHRLRGVDDAYKFTQKEQDQESGLHYFEARYLSGLTGIFISTDSKFVNCDQLPKDQFDAFLAEPQMMHFYSYVQKNPLKYTDPSGHDRAVLSSVGDSCTEAQLDRIRPVPIRTPGQQYADAPTPGITMLTRDPRKVNQEALDIQRGLFFGAVTYRVGMYLGATHDQSFAAGGMANTVFMIGGARAGARSGVDRGGNAFRPNLSVRADGSAGPQVQTQIPTAPTTVTIGGTKTPVSGGGMRGWIDKLARRDAVRDHIGRAPTQPMAAQNPD